VSGTKSLIVRCVSGVRAVRDGCVVHTKYALATLSWTEMRASLRVCAQHSPEVFRRSGVHERERTENKVVSQAFPRTLCLFLDLFIHVRDMLPPESIKIGVSLARVKDRSDSTFSSMSRSQQRRMDSGTSE
jgi:hypothetical protein